MVRRKPDFCDDSGNIIRDFKISLHQDIKKTVSVIAFAKKRCLKTVACLVHCVDIRSYGLHTGTTDSVLKLYKCTDRSVLCAKSKCFNFFTFLAEILSLINF